MMIRALIADGSQRLVIKENKNIKKKLKHMRNALVTTATQQHFDDVV